MFRYDKNGADIRLNLIQRYQYLTKNTMPEAARTLRHDWPVQNDHCFQRIVLDAIAGGIWYDHISRPAYKHLSLDQARRAVELCENILSGETDLTEMNHQSLKWRGKR